MPISNEAMLFRLTAIAIGDDAARETLDMLELAPEVTGTGESRVSRPVFATALAALLFRRLLETVPSGAAYVADRIAQGRRINFDHGALRTIRFAEGPTGALPGGQDSFARILEPLGYEMVKQYPLPRLRMTGHAWCHRDFPEAIPQYFVSELHVDQFDDGFGAAARRVFGGSRDPLTPEALAVLDHFGKFGAVDFADAAAALPVIAAAFDRQHGDVDEADYAVLINQSAEAGWIATEGNAFNHATDRVDDVEALADALRAEGHPIKDRVEVSQSGRVRQTAFRADIVERGFVTADRQAVTRGVPGSFFEFISRDPLPEATGLDLAFDSANATGIFAMTRAA
ncbi:2-oxoadipate dioxygenase/decarboxylase family protein [Stakelama tenebrarum]|uniref:2-oxoadipate dioxygenase/decarboxylase n=1 Tax=Stakelama tenebrarum TaxID=2711215 RepID=A0A6G6YAM1_9SPHN|nr:DUF1338 family protein [Sphingosinithalassobacter tenebrarum]QIG81891.1 DUF1338 family protein [Sphingosinithalassobacter tenebrarum]